MFLLKQERAKHNEGIGLKQTHLRILARILKLKTKKNRNQNQFVTILLN